MTQPRLDGNARNGPPRARRDRVHAPKFFGLVELDTEGTVLYARDETDAAAAGARDVTGQNFYTEVAPFTNVGEFRQRVEDFRRGTLPAFSMNFTCQYDDGPLDVRVLLARIRERTEAQVTKSLLVHIRRAQ